MPVDWSQFRTDDRVRVTLEGVYHAADEYWDQQVVFDNDHRLYLGPRCRANEAGQLIKSAELIERPFTPPEAGKLFRSGSGALHISQGPSGFLTVRTPKGNPSLGMQWMQTWEDTDEFFRSGIEVLDV